MRLLSHEVLDPGRLTVVEGDLAACRAALDAGSAAARRTGCVISRREIGRPEEDTQRLIGGFQPPPPAPMPPADPASSKPTDAAGFSSWGMTAGEVAAHLPGRWIRPPCAGAALFRRGRYENAAIVSKSTTRRRCRAAAPALTIMKKRRSANLHHLCCEALPEDRADSQAEIDNIHQRYTTDV